jgi:hypothetical protein
MPKKTGLPITDEVAQLFEDRGLKVEVHDDFACKKWDGAACVWEGSWAEALRNGALTARPKENIKGVVFSHTAIKSCSPQNILETHRDQNHYSAPGYQLYFTKDGIIHIMRPLEALPATCYG